MAAKTRPGRLARPDRSVARTGRADPGERRAPAVRLRDRLRRRRPVHPGASAAALVPRLADRLHRGVGRQPAVRPAEPAFGRDAGHARRRRRRGVHAGTAGALRQHDAEPRAAVPVHDRDHRPRHALFRAGGEVRPADGILLRRARRSHRHGDDGGRRRRQPAHRDADPGDPHRADRVPAAVLAAMGRRPHHRHFRAGRGTSPSVPAGRCRRARRARLGRLAAWPNAWGSPARRWSAR